MSAAPTLHAEAPFGSLAEMQLHHAALVKEVGTGPLERPHEAPIVEFIRRTLATGTILDAKEDRAAAQGLINFWTARLTSAACDANRSRGSLTTVSDPRSEHATEWSLDDTLLAEFSPETLDTARAAADRWIGSLPDDDQSSVRRIFLRLVRLTDDNRTFVPTPTTRSALQDIDGLTPEGADTLLDGLVKAGVVRVTPGASPRVDQVALRSESLLNDWPTLERYLSRRREFRNAVVGWDRAGRNADALLKGDELDEARNYHDRNTSERQFIDASRRKEWRANQTTRGLLFVVTPLLLLALVGWGIAVNRSLVAQHNEKEVRRFSDALREKQHLSEMTSLIRTLAILGNAPEAECKIAFLRLDATDRVAVGDTEVRTFFDQNRGHLASIRTAMNENRKIDSSELKEVQVAALNLARGVKENVLKMADSKELMELLQTEREVVFKTVQFCAQQLVARYERENYDPADAYRKEFWILYWGEMGLVEGPEVERAMVRFGDILERIDDQIARRLESDKISTKGPSWKGLNSRQAIQQAAIDTVHLAESHIPSSFRQVKVDPSDVEALKMALIDLNTALALEQKQPLGFVHPILNSY